MSSKTTVSNPIQKRVFFQRWQLVAAAVVSLVLWIVWFVTTPGLDLVLNTRPLYFPEAPYWHSGLYVGASLAMGYAIVGGICMWIERGGWFKSPHSAQ